jgi:transcription elongation factor GreA
MTLKGAERLRGELRRLKSEDRPRIIQAIAEARAHGDLSENAEYHAAREQQAFCEGRIKELEHELSHCEIIDVSSMPKVDRVVFGATVDLQDQDGGPDITFQIVGELEADVRMGLISITSPIARGSGKRKATWWTSRCRAARARSKSSRSATAERQPGSRMPGFSGLRR